jgi:hypothetical protein
MIGRLIQGLGIAVTIAGVWLVWPIVSPIWFGEEPLYRWFPTPAAYTSFFRYLLFIVAIAPGMFVFYFGTSRLPKKADD